MKSTIETENVKDLTGIEIMHYILLWCYNWTQEDFKTAFKDSHLGWDYFWDKLQGKCSNKNDNPDNPTNAIVGIILNMDGTHQNMLFDFILKKYTSQILKRREDKVWMDEAIAKSKKNEN